MTNEGSPSLPVNRQTIYNPGRLTDDEVKASFIARQALLGLILDDVTTTQPKGFSQHHLIVGQRGMGKTTLLRRLDVALREPPLNEHFLPLGFPEEQYALDRLSKLWLNCLDSLADTLEREGEAVALIRKIDDQVCLLHAHDRPEHLLAEVAETAFLEISSETGRKPVLLIDNLDLVFDRLDAHELNRLRAFLMRPGAPILIGACVSPPNALHDYSAPFYDHFKTHYLNRLSLEEMRQVLVRLAECAGNKEIPNRLDSEMPRLKALHVLTGGNPRTTVVLFQIFAKGFSKEAYQDLESILDWMTPLYKSRFEELPAQAQVVVSALALHWEPATGAQLSTLTRLENNRISPQLDRLKKAGIIEAVTVDDEERTGPIPEGRSPKDRIGYQLSERFFNIWFLMRQATRRDRRNLAFLTRFIECAHTPAERDAMAASLMEKPGLSCEEPISGLSLESALASHALRLKLHDHVQQEWIEPLTTELGDTIALHEALFASFQENWGLATEHLSRALDLIRHRAAFPSDSRDDWMRASAVLLHLDYGPRLLNLLAKRGDDQRLRPWYEAIRALLRGDRHYLRNIPAEMREVAGMLYDQISTRLLRLPESTKRWSRPADKQPARKV